MSHAVRVLHATGISEVPVSKREDSSASTLKNVIHSEMCQDLACRDTAHSDATVSNHLLHFKFSFVCDPRKDPLSCADGLQPVVLLRGSR